MPDDKGAGDEGWRARIRRLTDPFYDMKRRTRLRAAAAWRRQFSRTTFIGVTGSYGKTTATAMIGAMLKATAPTYVQIGHNQTKTVARSVLRTMPWHHRYSIQEISAEAPMVVDSSFDVFRPTVGIVTAVSGDHRKAYGGSMEAIAAEKAKLVHRLPSGGLAVLNADDPLVAAMGAGCICRVVYHGRREDADLRLLDAKSVWPGRLELDVSHRGESFHVKTRLVGTHWTVSVMAALLAALELGVDRSVCLATIEAFEPLFDRMSVHPGPNGAWYVLDANKASFFGIDACLGFLSPAVVPRKTVVVGSIADYPGASRSHYNKIARMALNKADRVIFTGNNAAHVRNLAADEFAGRLLILEQPKAVVDLVQADAVAGEIIYVKSASVDRLARLFVPRDHR